MGEKVLHKIMWNNKLFLLNQRKLPHHFVVCHSYFFGDSYYDFDDVHSEFVPALCLCCLQNLDWLASSDCFQAIAYQFLVDDYSNHLDELLVVVDFLQIDYYQGLLLEAFGLLVFSKKAFVYSRHYSGHCC